MDWMDFRGCDLFDTSGSGDSNAGATWGVFLPITEQYKRHNKEICRKIWNKSVWNRARYILRIVQEKKLSTASQWKQT